MRTTLLLPLVLGIAACTDSDDSESSSIVITPDSVVLAVIGDVPDQPDSDKAIAEFPQLIQSINTDPTASTTIHVGDIKGGETPCVDQSYQDVFNLFQTFDQPLIYSIGDNEWTDCDRASAGSYDPEERLTKLREIFFSVPGTSLGKTTRQVSAQESYPENQLWQEKGLTFATLHVVGTNNNLITRAGTPSAVEQSASGSSEYGRRNNANISWIRNIFQQAMQDQSAGVALFLHADMWKTREEFSESILGGFRQTIQELSIQAEAFGKPVLIVSGDNRFREDQGVTWFSLYDVSPVSNITQVIVPRGIQYVSNNTKVRSTWLKLAANANPTAESVFDWVLVSSTYPAPTAQ